MIFITFIIILINMAKKLNVYSNGIEKCWYDSSNVIYTECIDNENKPKTLKVVFSNGTQYQYNDVRVMDYLVFREDASQGKALNRLIKEKKYGYIKLENADLEKINEELSFRLNNGIFIENNDYLKITNYKDEVLYKSDKKVNEENYDVIINILKSIGIKFKEL